MILHHPVVGDLELSFDSFPLAGAAFLMLLNLSHSFTRSPKEKDRSAELSFWISAWAASLTL